MRTYHTNLHCTFSRLCHGVAHTQWWSLHYVQTFYSRETAAPLMYTITNCFHENFLLAIYPFFFKVTVQNQQYSLRGVFSSQLSKGINTGCILPMRIHLPLHDWDGWQCVQDTALCVCICTYVQTFMRVHVHTHMCVHIYIFILTYAQTYICL